jgi:hypothetical protein
MRRRTASASVKAAELVPEGAFPAFRNGPQRIEVTGRSNGRSFDPARLVQAKKLI